MQTLYVALVLEPESREALLRAHPPVHVTLHAHHITLAFGACAVLDRFALGARHAVDTQYLLENPRVQVAAVQFPDGAPAGSDPQQRYHITVSCAAHAKPVESNAALRAPPTHAHAPLRLYGTVTAIRQ